MHTYIHTYINRVNIHAYGIYIYLTSLVVTFRYAKLNLARTAIAQLLGLKGLAHTAQRTLGGRKSPNPAFMTWEPPTNLIGRENELIADLPEINRSLCAEVS